MIINTTLDNGVHRKAENALSEIGNWVNHSRPVFMSYTVLIKLRLQYLITIEHVRNKGKGRKIKQFNS